MAEAPASGLMSALASSETDDDSRVMPVSTGQYPKSGGSVRRNRPNRTVPAGARPLSDSLN